MQIIRKKYCPDLNTNVYVLGYNNSLHLLIAKSTKTTLQEIKELLEEYEHSQGIYSTKNQDLLQSITTSCYIANNLPVKKVTVIGLGAGNYPHILTKEHKAVEISQPVIDLYRELTHDNETEIIKDSIEHYSQSVSKSSNEAVIVDVYKESEIPFKPKHIESLINKFDYVLLNIIPEFLDKLKQIKCNIQVYEHKETTKHIFCEDNITVLMTRKTIPNNIINKRECKISETITS